MVKINSIKNINWIGYTFYDKNHSIGIETNLKIKLSNNQFELKINKYNNIIITILKSLTFSAINISTL